ncbi:hypothetical protein GJ689_00120 [Rhodoplanes serenus]|uniref:Uncharacterized protein n=1 Tax=Rhodoplanes serenus TaxID=200615 RepID=A0A9X4XHX3_9BRAD|nr:DUF6101 family protein [Rhodoplanes serenus]MTW14619.1 hypothetical protein [Rhodoplanes serenus]
MSAGGVTPSGSSRHARLDPFALPIRFTTADTATDTRLRDVELGRDRVVLRRTVSGMRMAMALPLDHFLGVTLNVVPPGDNDDGAVAIVLSHRDAALSVPLYVADDGTEAIAEWQLWAKVLGLPLLIADPDGVLREPFPRLGSVRVGAPQLRRRRCGPVKRRRASILMRRKPGRMPARPRVIKDEREIIARS